MLRILSALVLLAVVSGCRPSAPTAKPSPAPVAPDRLLPLPVSLRLTGGDVFTVDSTTAIVVDSSDADVSRIADMLAALMRPSTGFGLPVRTAPGPRTIALRLSSSLDALGPEGYQLVATRDSVRITAGRPAGLFHGIQTLRQLLPPQIESQMSLSGISWSVPAIAIEDRPRFAWRGAMLDVARHFFTVREVKQYLDILSLYKLNTLHLHLADDQGWRIEIKSRPRLAQMGGVTQVAGGPGGYYTQDEFTDLVKYAADRFITIVPEIDLPGHANAALIGYPELNCSGTPPAPYTGIHTGVGTFCVDKDETYRLIDDVIREITSLTPGAYFHIGGDEVRGMQPEAYAGFVRKAQDIVNRHGKQMIGWEEIARVSGLLPSTIVQQWTADTIATQAVRAGSKAIMSPAPRMYLDMKYDANTELGLRWAALIEVRDAYDWDPAAYAPGIGEANIVGIEAPMWSETLRNITAVEYLAIPRLPAIAEVGWTPQASRSWESVRVRLAAQAPRWNVLGVNYYRSPQIPW